MSTINSHLMRKENDTRLRCVYVCNRKDNLTYIFGKPTIISLKLFIHRRNVYYNKEKFKRNDHQIPDLRFIELFD